MFRDVSALSVPAALVTSPSGLSNRRSVEEASLYSDRRLSPALSLSSGEGSSSSDGVGSSIADGSSSQIYRCSRQIQAKATASIEALMKGTVKVGSREARVDCHEGWAREGNLGDVLGLLQKTATYVISKYWGVDRDSITSGKAEEAGFKAIPSGGNPFSIALKGGLAARAVLGEDLAHALRAGGDLDLVMDARNWLPAERRANEGPFLAAQIAVTWVYGLLHGCSASQAYEYLQSKEGRVHHKSLFQHFFLKRMAVRPNSEGVGDCWALYSVALQIDEQTASSLDLAILFHSERPFLTNDASFQVQLPIGEDPLEVVSWVNPRAGLSNLRESSFSIPDLHQVRMGALEKVLSKMSGGAVYRWEGESQSAQQTLIEHFLNSCPTEQQKRRLQSVPQPSWGGARRIIFWMQVAQLFADSESWVPKEVWPEIESWPDCLAPLALGIIEANPVERAWFLRLFAPVISGLLAEEQHPPLPTWGEACFSDVEQWLGLPAEHPLRIGVGRLRLLPAIGQLPPKVMELWWQKRGQSAEPGLEARLILSLASASAEDMSSAFEQAVACCLEATCSDEVLALLTPWPQLQRAVRATPLLGRALMRWKTPFERKMQWCQALAHLPICQSLLTEYPVSEGAPTALEEALWAALEQQVKAREPLSPGLSARALKLWSEHRAPSTRLLLRMISEGTTLEEPDWQKVIHTLACRLQRPCLQEDWGADLRCWLRVLREKDLYLAPSVFDALHRAVQLKRWQSSSSLVADALIDRLAVSTPRARDRSQWVQMLRRCGESYPELWHTLPRVLFAEVEGPDAVSLLKEVAGRNAWVPDAISCLQRALEHPTEGKELAALAVQFHWPLADDLQWRVALDAILSASGRDQITAAASQLAQHSARANAPPTADEEQRLGAWIQRTAPHWVHERRTAMGPTAARLLWESAHLWRSKWNHTSLFDSLLKAAWEWSIQRQVAPAQQRDPLSGGSQSRGTPKRMSREMTVQASSLGEPLLFGCPRSIERSEWIEATLQHLIEGPVQEWTSQALQEDPLVEELFRCAAQVNPARLAELCKPGALLWPALARCSLQQTREIWLGLFDIIPIQMWLQIIPLCGMVHPPESCGSQDLPSIAWLSKWTPLLHNEPPLDILLGWLASASQGDQKTLSQDPERCKITAVAANLAAALLLHGSYQGISLNQIGEQWLWAALTRWVEALKINGRALEVQKLPPLWAMAERLVVAIERQRLDVASAFSRLDCFGTPAFASFAAVILSRMSSWHADLGGLVAGSVLVGLMQRRELQHLAARSQSLPLRAEESAHPSHSKGLCEELALDAVMERWGREIPTGLLQRVAEGLTQQIFDAPTRLEIWRILPQWLAGFTLQLSATRTDPVLRLAHCAIDDLESLCSSGGLLSSRLPAAPSQSLQPKAGHLPAIAVDSGTSAALAQEVGFRPIAKGSWVHSPNEGTSRQLNEVVLPAAQLGRSPLDEEIRHTVEAISQIALVVCSYETRGREIESIQSRLLQLISKAYPALTEPYRGALKRLTSALEASAWHTLGAEEEPVKEGTMRSECRALMPSFLALPVAAVERMRASMQRLLLIRAATEDRDVGAPTQLLHLHFLFWSVLHDGLAISPESIQWVYSVDWSACDGVPQELPDLIASSYQGVAHAFEHAREVHAFVRSQAIEEQQLPLDRLITLLSGVMSADREEGILQWIEIMDRTTDLMKQQSPGKGGLAFGFFLRAALGSFQPLAREIEHFQNVQDSTRKRAAQLSARLLRELLICEQQAKAHHPDLLTGLILQTLSIAATHGLQQPLHSGTKIDEDVQIQFGSIPAGFDDPNQELSVRVHRERVLCACIQESCEALYQLDHLPKILRAIEVLSDSMEAHKGFGRGHILRDAYERLLQRGCSIYTSRFLELQGVGRSFLHVPIDGTNEEMIRGFVLESFGILGMPLDNGACFALLCTHAVWLGALGSHFPSLVMEYLDPWLRQASDKILLWLHSLGALPASRQEVLSQLELVARIAEPTLQAGLAQWMESGVTAATIFGDEAGKETAARMRASQVQAHALMQAIGVRLLGNCAENRPRAPTESAEKPRHRRRR